MRRQLWMFKPPRSFWLRYGIALFAFLLALVARWGLTDLLGTRAPGAIFLLATLFSAVFAGLYPSLLTLFIGATAAFYLFASTRPEEPTLSLAISIGLYYNARTGDHLLRRCRRAIRASCWNVRLPSVVGAS